MCKDKATKARSHSSRIHRKWQSQTHGLECWHRTYRRCKWKWNNNYIEATDGIMCVCVRSRATAVNVHFFIKNLCKALLLPSAHTHIQSVRIQNLLFGIAEYLSRSAIQRKLMIHHCVSTMRAIDNQVWKKEKNASSLNAERSAKMRKISHLYTYACSTAVKKPSSQKSRGNCFFSVRLLPFRKKKSRGTVNLPFWLMYFTFGFFPLDVLFFLQRL